MKKISIIIPCYNSASTINKVIDEIIDTIKMTSMYDYEIILVSDGSPDNVYEIIEKQSSCNGKIIGLELTKNFGQHAALMAGFNVATGDFVVAADDDGQTPIDQMLELIKPLEDGFDVAYAKYETIKQSSFRKVGSKANDLMLRSMLSKPKDITVNSFFACSNTMVNEINKYEGPYPYIPGLLLRATNKICNISVNHRERVHGTSNYTIKKLVSLWLNGFTAFSIKPLRIATILGFVTAILGFVSMVYIIIKKLFINPEVPMGYSSQISVILFIGGIIILISGMIGEYIGRIYMSINNTPQYIIKRKTS